MIRPFGPLRVLVLALALALAGQRVQAAEPAELSVVAFEGDRPAGALDILVDGRPSGRTDADGAALLRLEAGTHQLELQRAGKVVLRYELRLVEGESAELIATLVPGGAVEVALESSHQGSAAASAAVAGAALGPPGTLRGRIVNAEDGKPVIGARVFVAGTPIDVRSNENGEFSVPVGAGTYAFSVVAADFATQTIEDVAIASEQETVREVQLTPAGLELPEFVVLEPFVEGSLAAFVEERRTTSAVADVLGAEQISRAGDSDAAGALKRVTGLTLVDGKYVYVRGLGERYSSVLVNGAQVPSPDPTRRVVPLDLFPTEILQGVVIQKTFSPEMPGEFGGGTIQLRTKTYPEDFFLKIGLGVGYLDGTTFEDGLRYAGGTSDWTGYDDDTRKLPESIQGAIAEFGQIVQSTPFNPNGFTPEEIAVFGRDLSTVWSVDERSIGPDGGGTVTIGDSAEFWDGIELGYQASVRYAHGWDTGEELRGTYGAISDTEIAQTQGFERLQTERNVDLSTYLAVGAELYENHRINANLILLRQTQDEAQIDTGYDDSPDQISKFYTLEWEENQLKTWQFGSEHVFPQLMDLGFNWMYSTSDARRYAPNTRKYRYDQVGAEPDSPFRYSSRSNNNQIVFGDLRDAADSLDANLLFPIKVGEKSTVTLYGGVSLLERDRDSEIRRYQYFGQDTVSDAELFGPLEGIFSDDNIFPGGVELREVTRNTDTYVASQDLDGYYLNVDYSWRELLRFTLGARQEKLDQEVTTFNIVNPEQVVSQSLIATDDILPSASMTWWIDQESQLRALYSETVSRPDFRELSDAPFTDPQLDAESIGNPDLVPAALKNYDLRYEYYFSPTEVASVAAFYKDLTTPIERTIQPSTGTLVTYYNASAAEIYGLEFDFYKSLSFVEDWKYSKRAIKDNFLGKLPWDDVYFGFNYAWIDSSIELSPELAFQTNEERPLQGQSPYVVNFQLGYQHPEGKQEWTLLYNRFGRRISQVGVNEAPDIYEEPVGLLDFVYARKFRDDEWTFKLRLRNLLDPEVRFTQGSEATREYKRGRGVILTLEWKPDF